MGPFLSEGKTAERDSIGYVCTKDSYNETFSWKKLSKLEMDIGVCTSERMGEFDTITGNTLVCYDCNTPRERYSRKNEEGETIFGTPIDPYMECGALMLASL